MRGLLTGFALLCLISPPAFAQWVYESAGGDFDDDGLHMALAASGGYGLAVRCNADMLQMIYVTPEGFSDGGESLKSISGAQIKVRVDSGQIHALSALAGTYGEDDKLGFASDVPIDLVKDIGAAKSRVSFVVEWLGQKWHEHRFSAAGSSKAIKSLTTSCPFFGSNPSSQ